MPYLTKQYKFCAAHRYWNIKWSKAENYKNFGDDIYIHGHNYTLDITIKGEINPETGFIIDDWSELEDRMLELYHNQELCERFSTNAYNIMKEHWNYNLYKKSLDKLFKYVASH